MEVHVNCKSCVKAYKQYIDKLLTLNFVLRNTEIGQEKAQNVIDTITNSYAAEGHAMPGMPSFTPGGMPGSGMPAGFPPPPFGFGGKIFLSLSLRLSCLRD